MEEILNDIFNTEKSVEKILQDAKEHAAQVKQKTEQEVTQRLADARRQAQEMSQQILALAQKNAELEKQKVLQQTQEENERLLKACEGKMKQTVDRIFGLIVRTSFAEKGND
ncbi:hypothetical protein JW935_07790 [candidate division KSB1 bacterium]|nr:hypothetical protein [candidate division KSB1 bacterium]